jgi:Mn2+/Fe2+ NRAMP family transporter
MEKIKDRILKFLHLDGTIKSLSGYVETRVALMKLEIREEVAGILSRGLMLMLIFMIGFLCLLFLFIGLANYLNMLLESDYAGYIIVALFFALLLLILLLVRKSFFKLLERQFVEMIKQKED